MCANYCEIIPFTQFAGHSRADRVQNQHISKIANQLHATVFVSDAFRNRVIESGLVGFEFVELWDSEEDQT